MDKHQLGERDICTKFITPAIQSAGWQQHQFREEVSLTDGRIQVRGKLTARIQNPDAKGGPKRADFVLYARPNLPLAVVEAKQASLARRARLFQRGDTARAVLEALLEKFANHGVQEIEGAKVLELPPFDQFGSKTQIRRGLFGGIENYMQAVQELEHALYDAPQQKQA